MIKVSIIGTAGRNGLMDNNGNTKFNYNNMVDIASQLINKIVQTNNTTIDNIIICSGGAALSDHVAILLFLQNKIKNLNLYLPCDYNGIEFISNNSVAKSANNYHHNFSRVYNISSLNEINLAIEKGANVKVFNGFFERNDQLAQSEYILAFAPNKDKNILINPSNPLLTSGTKYTWNKSKTNKIYIPI